MSAATTHQLFLGIRVESPCDVADLDTWTWSLVTGLCRALDWSVVGQSTAERERGVTVTSVATDHTGDPITITTFWRHACTLVEFPPIEASGVPLTAMVLEAEFTDSPDFVVRAGASHPVRGHMVSIDELLWFENTRRHWERADLGPTLEELD
ncbi:hypothetical protein [Williamsia sp. M5A3_1d]